MSETEDTSMKYIEEEPSSESATLTTEETLPCEEAELTAEKDSEEPGVETEILGDGEPPEETEEPRDKVTHWADHDFENNVTVAGTLRAKRFVHPFGARFADEASMLREYPTPRPGMWATTGPGIPGVIWVCMESGKWEKLDPSSLTQEDIENIIAGRFEEVNRKIEELSAKLQEGGDKTLGDTLVNLLNNKADAIHTHAIADVSGLQTALKAKLDASVFNTFKSEFESMFIKEPDGKGGYRIKAKLGLYTDEYLSALGLNPDAAGSGASALGDLDDVTITKPTSGQGLIYDGTKWINGNVSSGLDKQQLQQYLNANGYDTLANMQKWVTGQGYALKSELVTTSERALWNQTATNLSSILGSNADNVINKWDEIVAFLDTYTEADTLANLLSNKANAVHTHAIADISGLQTTLDDKLSVSVFDTFKSDYDAFKAEFDSMFVKEPDGNGSYRIKAIFGLYSESFLSAMGLNANATGGGMDKQQLQVYLNTNGYDTLANTQAWVQGQSYATQSWVQGLGYATEQWVTSKGYLTASALNGYATEQWVTSKGYLTASALNGYATEQWVENKKYLTQAAFDTFKSSYNTWKSGIDAFKAEFDSMFVKEPDGNGSYRIKAIFGLYSESFLSAMGLNANATGSGMDAGALSTYLKTNGYDTLANTQAWVQGQGYATQSWVQSWVQNQKYLTSVSWSIITGKPTTLSGYGITDAHISGNVITLGSNKIIALTTHQSIYSLTFAAGVFSAKTFTANSAAATVNIPTNTSHISESGNLYFTNARAIDALSDITNNLSSRISVFETMFALEPDGNNSYRIRAKYGLYTNSFLSAMGLNADASGGSGGGLDTTQLQQYLNTNGYVTLAQTNNLYVAKNAVVNYNTLLEPKKSNVIASIGGVSIGCQIADYVTRTELLGEETSLTNRGILGNYVKREDLPDYPSLSDYLPLSGGTITGNLTVANALTVNGNISSQSSVILSGAGGRKLTFNTDGVKAAAKTDGDGCVVQFGAYKSDNTTALGAACGAFIAKDALQYFYYGGTWDAPFMKLMPTGVLDVKGSVLIQRSTNNTSYAPLRVATLLEGARSGITINNKANPYWNIATSNSTTLDFYQGEWDLGSRVPALRLMANAYMLFNGNIVWHAGNLSKVSQLSNDAGYLTNDDIADYNYATISDLPTKTSQLVNDSGFLTSSSVASNYVTTNTAQPINALKTFTAGLQVSGRVGTSGDGEGIVVGYHSNNWAALCLGDYAGERSVFYKNKGATPLWRYHNGSSTFDVHHPAKSGTIALTSDIPSLANLMPHIKLNGGLQAISTVTTWGNTTGTQIAEWADSTGNCGFKLKKDNPSSGKLSMLIDGTVYINEGAEAVASQSWVNGRGFLTAHQSLANYLPRSGGSMTNANVVTNLNADLLDGNHASRFLECQGFNNSRHIYVMGDPDKYYPVVISKPRTSYPATLLNISRRYNDTAPDSWYTPTHKGGLTLSLLYNGSRYWDGNGTGSPGVVSILMLYQSYCYMVGGIGSATDGLVVWLRGGNASYYIHSDLGSEGLSVTIYYDTYTDSAKNTFPVLTSPRDYSALSSLQVNVGGNANTATRLQTARTIWGQSFNGTADVGGSIGSPTAPAAAVYANNWFRSVGNNGWYSETYGGGIYMEDSSWIRIFNGKHFYAAGGIIRTDGSLQVGDNGKWFLANSSGATVLGNTVWHAGNFDPEDYLPLSGGSITGPINLGPNVSIGVKNQSRKLIDYIDSQDIDIQNWAQDNFLDLCGGTMTGDIILDNASFVQVNGEAGRVCIFNQSGVSVNARPDSGGSVVQFMANKSDGKTALGAACGVFLDANALKYCYYGGSWDAPKMVIMPSGDVGINTTTPTGGCFHLRKHLLVANANAYFNSSNDGSGSGAIMAWVNNALVVMAGASRSWVRDIAKFHYDGSMTVTGTCTAKSHANSSDIRLKNILGYLTLDVSTIAAAPSVRFSWKDSPGVFVGTIAQYWLAKCPEAVNTGHDGFYGVQYDALALISAISIARKVVSHESRITVLERENMQLRADYQRLEDENRRLNNLLQEIIKSQTEKETIKD